MPFWGCGAGGSGVLRPACDDPETFQQFLFDHCSPNVSMDGHHVVVLDEDVHFNHDYNCEWQEADDDPG
jgi:hypothetical protein